MAKHGSMKGLSRKKVSSCRQQFLAASHSTYRAPFKLSHDALAPAVQRTSKPLQLTVLALVDRFCFCFWSCRLHSRFTWSPAKTCQPWFYLRLQSADWAYDYFWLCVGAYSSDWSLV
jgi:hypothetical protein